MRDISHDNDGRALPRRQALRSTLAVGFVTLLGALISVPAHAGCGCQKPPPKPAQVRPQVTYASMPVQLISNALIVGTSYDVTFRSMNGQAATVRGQAASRRDLADGTPKPELVVAVPALPLGPASITVRAVGATAAVLTISDATFTVAPNPIALPTEYGSWTYPGHQAAVDRDGVVYLSLDLTGMTKPLVFEAALAGYPLRFTEADVIFTNTQGFLMQLLVSGSTKKVKPIPGMFVVPAEDPVTTSDAVHYSRHEFETYYLEHFERQVHEVDPNDSSWHRDGTRHVDHDHLIVGIVARLNNGALPGPGATPLFDLKLKAYSIFYQGLVGTDEVALEKTGTVLSCDPATSGVGEAGDVFTNGKVRVRDQAAILGNATATTFEVASGASISGARIPLASPMTFMPLQVPVTAPEIPKIELDNGASYTLVGPGSFRLDKLKLNHQSRLYVDNTAGPITLYVKDEIRLENGSEIEVADPTPETFAVYLSSNKDVLLKGDGSRFFGVVYAPKSELFLDGTGYFTGAFLGKKITVKGDARICYDSRLRGQ